MKQSVWKTLLLYYFIGVFTITAPNLIMKTFIIHKVHAQTAGHNVIHTTPTPAVYSPTQEKIIRLIEKVWGKKDSPVGIAIASCESGLDPDKVNYNTDNSVDYQVFQVNTVHGVILDTEENVSYAYKLYSEQGTTPWDSSKGCWGDKI